MSKQHHYKTAIRWTGNKGRGTIDYRAYDRSYVVSIENKVDIMGSSDVAFRGDGLKHNPEEMLLASLSSCHMLWYLHLCADASVVVVDYVDHAEGLMLETNNGGGRFTKAILNPQVVVQNTLMIEKAIELHERAHEKCFIANSVNFPVAIKTTIQTLE